MPPRSWLDRLTGWFAPVWTLRRERARTAAVLLREYEGASVGRRTSGWNRTSGDANAAGTELGRLRETARDLVRNNPIASAALDLIADHAVGTGLVAKPMSQTKAARNQAMDRWHRWADTTACDADGRHDFAGLQKLVMRTVAEAGEVLVRRRYRRLEDGLPIPLQLQVLEPDYLDATRDTLPFGKGGPRVIGGIEFDGIGRRTAYYLLSEHPGSGYVPGTTSARIPAEDVLHVFRSQRPGQARGVTWFAPVMTRLKELDEYEDAALVKQKIAACLAVIVTDVDGSSAPGVGGVNPTEPTWAMLSPGMIHKAPAGQAVSVVQPPIVNEHAAFVATVLRTIAAGLGLTCEDLTGNYESLPFSAARMSRLRHWARVDDWRWRMLIPQFCDPVWVWAMTAASIVSTETVPPGVKWTCPPAPMIDPAQEGLAYQRNIRTGIQTLSDAIRERGEDPEEVFDEMASDAKILDRLGLILDSDARNTTQGGQLQGAAAAKTAPAPVAPVVPTANGYGTNGAGH
jgi:lambda family phage portal protein